MTVNNVRQMGYELEKKIGIHISYQNKLQMNQKFKH